MVLNSVLLDSVPSFLGRAWRLGGGKERGGIGDGRSDHGGLGGLKGRADGGHVVDDWLRIV